MSDTARKHHFVPAFYLAGFTATRHQEGYLVATDLKEGRQFPGTPRSLAFVNDLYRVEHPDLDPDHVERAFASVENEVAPAVARLTANRARIDSHDLAVVLNLLAMLAVRVPAVRRMFADPLEKLGRRLADLSFQDRTTYDKFIKGRQEAGEDTSRYLTFEELKAGWEREGVTVQVDPTYLTLTTLRLAAELYPWLSARSWTVVRTDQLHGGTLVTSDRPVVLLPLKVSPPIYGSGFGMRDTEVLFPLDTRTVLIGTWDEDDRVSQVGPEVVPRLNRRVIRCAHRFVYSPSTWYRYGDPEAGLYSSDMLVADVARQGAEMATSNR